MFETLQRHRLVTQRRWQTVPCRGTRRKKRAVTECDCLCSGDQQFVVVGWSQPGPASNRRDRHAESSEARYAGAGEGLHFDYMESKISCFLTATTTTTTTTTTTATTTTDVSSQLVLNGAIVRRQDRLEHSWRSVVVSTA